LEALLQDEQVARKNYQQRIQHLEGETKERSATIEELSRREKGFEEKCREQVRSYNSWWIRPLTMLDRNASYSLREILHKG
jgi:hypothetical protein